MNNNKYDALIAIYEYFENKYRNESNYQEKRQLRDKITDLRNPAKLAELKPFEEKKLELDLNISQNSLSEAEIAIGSSRVWSSIRSNRSDVYLHTLVIKEEGEKK